MSNSILLRKQDELLNFLNNDALQNKLSDPKVSAIGLSFPIKYLIKSRDSINNVGPRSVDPMVSIYSSTDVGFFDWYA